MAVAPASIDRSPRLRAAINELVDAILEDVGAQAGQQPTRLLSIDEAANQIGVGRSTIYQEITAGRLRSVKVGKRRLIPESAIDELAAEGRRATADRSA